MNDDVPQLTTEQAIAVAFAGEPRLLRVSDAARRLGVHVNTIRAWIHSGKIAAVRWPSGHFRVAEEDVIALLGVGGPAPRR